MYNNIVRPLLFRLDPERVHEVGIEALRVGLRSELVRERFAERLAVSPFGELERFGLGFSNPIGVAAGFDKNGKVVDQLAAIGFGFVEVGTITYEPQPGNEKPRLFRLPDDHALINRLGFNNDGVAAIVSRLKKIKPACVLGVNIGKNKNVPIDEATENYLKSFEIAHEVADYVAINVSSPNTPDLRELQRAEHFEELVTELQKQNRNLGIKPLLVKIGPDLDEGEIETLVDICLTNGVSGIIATNTTISRDGLRTKGAEKIGAGGLSGKPLRRRSTEIIANLFRYSGGKMPIIGVGGISTAQDAFEKIAAGACLLQAYTGFVYQGISYARDINIGLKRIVEVEGFKSLDEAIGSGVHEGSLLATP
ncbi:MAG: quinone-dependent dihydroorotate dehydrogenase [Acidobacteria bacterium]|nr:quinone-dependent dihydroorotate dehydrogenase [Acidobacteriota bacterium]MCA1608861.1 quinone-dependent dihydroorotate dehydrogenase [Acidobacteriota bacterium]